MQRGPGDVWTGRERFECSECSAPLNKWELNNPTGHVCSYPLPAKTPKKRSKKK